MKTTVVIYFFIVFSSNIYSQEKGGNMLRHGFYSQEEVYNGLRRDFVKPISYLVNGVEQTDSVTNISAVINEQHDSSGYCTCTIEVHYPGKHHYYTFQVPREKITGSQWAINDVSIWSGNGETGNINMETVGKTVTVGIAYSNGKSVKIT
jgi:hypothetical protein